MSFSKTLAIYFLYFQSNKIHSVCKISIGPYVPSLPCPLLGATVMLQISRECVLFALFYCFSVLPACHNLLGNLKMFKSKSHRQIF